MTQRSDSTKTMHPRTITHRSAWVAPLLLPVLLLATLLVLLSHSTKVLQAQPLAAPMREVAAAVLHTIAAQSSEPQCKLIEINVENVPGHARNRFLITLPAANDNAAFQLSRAYTKGQDCANALGEPFARGSKQGDQFVWFGELPADTYYLRFYANDEEPHILDDPKGALTARNYVAGTTTRGGLPPATIPFSKTLIWQSTPKMAAASLAWGDVDNDGDLDLAVASKQISKFRRLGIELSVASDPASYLFVNEDGRLNANAVWQSTERKPTSVAWGDMDADGYLDLAVATEMGVEVYRNDGGQLHPSAIWQSADHQPAQGRDLDRSISVAWGDMDANGYLDLAVATENGVEVYRNDGGQLNPNAIWQSGLGKSTSVAWGDMNDNGYLDLMVTIANSVVVYHNDGGQLQEDPLDPTPADGIQTCPQSIPRSKNIRIQVDIDGNGILDTLIGDQKGLFLVQNADCINLMPGHVSAMAWADVDGDGDLDVAIGQDEQLRLYRNESDLYRSIQSSKDRCTNALSVWGDLDNDGHYDIVQVAKPGTEATAQAACPLQILHNVTNDNSGDLQWNRSAITLTDLLTNVTSVAWADVDGDGDLDLAVSGKLAPVRLYKNDLQNGQTRLLTKTWQTTDTLRSTALAWGDADGDGDLDLAVSNVPQLGQDNEGSSIGKNQIFYNENGELQSNNQWIAEDDTYTGDLHWIDYDSDGDLDLIAEVLFGENADEYLLYQNEDQGQLEKKPRLITLAQPLQKLTDFDVNGDGQADQIEEGRIKLYDYFPADPSYPAEPPLKLFLTEPGRLAPATTAVQGTAYADGRLAIPYAITGPAQRLYDVFGFYSLDGGLTWQAAITATTAVTGTVNNTATRKIKPGKHTYLWDFFANGITGAQENVRFRLQVRPNLQPMPGGAPGPYQIPFIQTETLPFRVQGRRVRVVDADGKAVAGAFVYQRPHQQFAQAVSLHDEQGNVLRTDKNGYLRSQTPIHVGDQLTALWPVSTAEITKTYPNFTFMDQSQYSFFHSSAKPTVSGLDSYEVIGGDVQTLTLTEANPLLLFHLSVSLEWDARSDTLFLQELAQGLKQASALLYDVTDGQAALGDIDLFYAKVAWDRANIQIYANNALRPSAAIGGIVRRPISETIVLGSSSITEEIKNAYTPGQIRMGTVWDPYGERTTELSEEWVRALAHELSHYLFFQFDSYIGVNEEGILTPQECAGSFMTNATDPTYSEFRTVACSNALATKTTNRSDWGTITNFYPMLHEPTSQKNNGPADLPLALTNIFAWEPTEQALPQPVRIFDLRAADAQSNQRIRLPEGHAYLIKTAGDEDPTNDLLIALGTPKGAGDHLDVRGADPGDRLCIFDNSGGRPYSGCVESITTEDMTLRAAPIADTYLTWRPEVSARSISSRTILVTVTQELSADEKLNVQLFPLHYGSVQGNAPVAATTVTTTAKRGNAGGPYKFTLTMTLPAFEVAVRVWVKDDQCTQDGFKAIKEEAGDNNGGNVEREHFYSCTRESISTFWLNPPQWEALTTSDPTAYEVLELSPRALLGPDDEYIVGVPPKPRSNVDQISLTKWNQGSVGGPPRIGTGSPLVAGPPRIGTGAPFMAGPPRIGTGAPTTLADGQIVIYHGQSVFKENGVENLQALAAVPELASHPWLVPVGQAYHIETSRAVTDKRYISFTYLQRDVPEGYEQTLTIYFLADGEKEWQRLGNTERFPKNNMVVAPLILHSNGAGVNGVYAVMSTIALPELTAGWSLLSYPVQESRLVTVALQSISGTYAVDQVFLVTGAIPRTDGQVDPLALRLQGSAGRTTAAERTNIQQSTLLEYGKSYLIKITLNEQIIPYVAPPRRLPDGTIPTPQLEQFCQAPQPGANPNVGLATKPSAEVAHASTSLPCDELLPTVALDPNMWYRLTNAFLGEERALDTYSETYKPFMGYTGNYSGQFWRFIPLGDGYYRLTNAFLGEERALDTYSGTYEPFMGDTGNYSGQFWQITPLADGYYRLTNAFLGGDRALDTYSDTHELFMGDTGNYSGQFWQITPIKPIDE